MVYSARQRAALESQPSAVCKVDGSSFAFWGAISGEQLKLWVVDAAVQPDLRCGFLGDPLSAVEDLSFEYLSVSAVTCVCKRAAGGAFHCCLRWPVLRVWGDAD